jgi:hypothetical protein
MKMQLGVPFYVAIALLWSGCRVSHLSAQESFYSPKQIHDLISSGVAQPHGAQSENRDLGCQTFLWEKSNDRHIFFFTRDGRALGEYRDEMLVKGEFLRIDELYLNSTARNSKVMEKLPFVRRLTTLHWDDDTWVGSTIEWTLLLRKPDGTVAEYLKHGGENTSKATVTVHLPTDLMAKDKKHYLALYKRNVSEFDKAFYHHIDEGKGLRLWWSEVVNGECEIRTEWPTQSPDFLFDLHERIPNPPSDAIPSSVRTKIIASMKRTSGINRGEVINFEPSQD